MKRLLLSALLLGVSPALGHAADFEPPVRLRTGKAAIRVESPGYAAPCFVDLKGDGTMQLLVGQFNGGKIKVYDYKGSEQFAPGKWLDADGKTAEVPGVW